MNQALIKHLSPLLLIIMGLALVYVPTFYDLFNGLWSTDQQAHGPIVLMLAFWFFYFRVSSLSQSHIALPIKPLTVLGWIILILGCVLYAIGRSQSLYIFEVGSFVVVLLALTLMFFGSSVAKYLWFAFFFLCFAVPLPASVVDVLTQPMKMAVSFAADHLLYFLDYPVARNGVVISIGQYQLLVADACAGLNSLFTLEALGLLYMNVTRHESALRNAILATLIIPISFAANVTRVTVLALITYYYGDEAGQGFVHEFSGMFLFIVALFFIIGVDSLIRYFTAKYSKQP